MARIRIEDLEPLQELTDEQLGSAVGGVSLSTTTLYDAWTPSSYTTTLYDAWTPSSYSTSTMYDAWMP